MCGQADKNVQLPVRPRGLIDVRRKFNLLLCPIVICRLTFFTEDVMMQAPVLIVFPRPFYKILLAATLRIHTIIVIVYYFFKM